MAKEEKTNESVEQGAASEQKTAEKVGSAAKQVTDNVFGDLFSIDSEKKKPAPELPEDTIELAVTEDRTRLLLTALAYLLLALVGLFLVAGGLGATQITDNMAYLVLMLIGLPISWFASRAMGKRFNRYAKQTHIIDFGEKYVFIYEKADPKEALVLTYRDIKNYQMIRQGNALRLLLKGNWVTHPSGLYLVDINKTFSSATLGELEKQIVDVMRAHHVNERKQK